MTSHRQCVQMRRRLPWRGPPPTRAFDGQTEEETPRCTEDARGQQRRPCRHEAAIESGRTHCQPEAT
eukprot:6541622-Pyramimonas_sp.AAC.1